MNDVELLKWAAKAAGLDNLHLGGTKPWNPLVDDGDALRLAVRLGISIIQPSSPWGSEGKVTTDVLYGTCEVNDDPYKATRRAIVIAAAEIDKQ